MTVRTQNYSLGMAELRFYDKTTLKTWDIGNIVAASIAPEITFLDHYTVSNGIRKKDRSLVTQKAVAINFTYDEITAVSIRHFLLATTSGGAMSGLISGATHRILPMQAGEINGSANLTFNSTYGRDFTWYIPSATFKPDGSFDFSAEDWMQAKGILEVTQATGTYSSTAPYGWLEFDDSWAYENQS